MVVVVVVLWCCGVVVPPPVPPLVLGSTAGSCATRWWDASRSVANNSHRGGLACFAEVVWTRVPESKLLRGKFRVNWLELDWKSQRTLTSTCVAMSTVCASSETSAGSLRHQDGEGKMLTSLLATLSIPSQRVRLQWAAQNHPWTSIQMGRATTIDQNVNPKRHPKNRHKRLQLRSDCT